MKFIDLFLLTTLAAALGFSKIGWAEEVLSCPPPRDWYTEPEARERWGGPDPTVSYRRDPDFIRVTHYGLEGSRFKTPEEYLSWIKRIIGEPLLGEKAQGGEIREMTVAGEKARRVQFQYEYEGYISPEGEPIPHESVYEEFIAVPGRNGFFALVLSNHRLTPRFAPSLKKSLEKAASELKPLLGTWKRFLEGCRFVDE